MFGGSGTKALGGRLPRRRLRVALLGRAARGGVDQRGSPCSTGTETAFKLLARLPDPAARPTLMGRIDPSIIVLSIGSQSLDQSPFNQIRIFFLLPLFFNQSSPPAILVGHSMQGAGWSWKPTGLRPTRWPGWLLVDGSRIAKATRWLLAGHGRSTGRGRLPPIRARGSSHRCSSRRAIPAHQAQGGDHCSQALGSSRRGGRGPDDRPRRLGRQRVESAPWTRSPCQYSQARPWTRRCGGALSTPAGFTLGRPDPARTFRQIIDPSVSIRSGLVRSSCPQVFPRSGFGILLQGTAWVGVDWQ